MPVTRVVASSRLLVRHHTRFLLPRYFSSSNVLTRASVSSSNRGTQKVRDKWNYNPSPFDIKPDNEYRDYPLIDAHALENEKKPPHKIKMLARDFIEDSLYNPNYGYFPKQATIFDTQDSAVNFEKLRDSAEFQEEVGKRYAAYGTDGIDGPGRQLWHTPTELFKPWYGRAVSQCLVAEYLLKYFPYEDFIIYEIGAGNGTLSMDILNYLQEEYPDVYERTRYNIIEISSSLAQLQRQKLSRVHPCVKVTHKSIFHWKTKEPAPCFIVAMEVIDNFAHDVIRYDLRTLEPCQGIVVIDAEGEFDMLYSPITDPLIAEFLGIRHRLGHPIPVNKFLRSSNVLRNIYLSLPFAPNLSMAEYLPTRLLSFLRTLRYYFPRHRLLLSDFSSLPDTIPGVNGPVVQTRFRNTTVPCTTFLVRQGYFDIFFPTNFDHLRDMYEFIVSRSFDPSSSLPPIRSTPLANSSAPVSMGQDFFFSQNLRDRRRPLDGVASASGLPVGERKSSVFTHSEFMETYADLGRTRLMNGENPMLDFYKNVKFLF